MKYGATSATDIAATSATPMMVRTAHWEVTSTPLGRAVARTIRRPSRSNAAKYDLDNRSGLLSFTRGDATRAAWVPGSPLPYAIDPKPPFN